MAIGLYVRVSLEETPAFKALEQDQRAAVPLTIILRDHWAALIQGSLAIVVCYALFYISTVYALGYGVRVLGIPRVHFLGLLCGAVVFMALATPLSAALADRFGRRPVLMTFAVFAILVGLAMPWLMAGGYVGVFAFLALALGAMGLTFAPLGALLARAFPCSRALHRRVEHIQSRRHPRRLLRAVAWRRFWKRRAASRGSAITLRSRA